MHQSRTSLDTKCQSLSRSAEPPQQRSGISTPLSQVPEGQRPTRSNRPSCPRKLLIVPRCTNTHPDGMGCLRGFLELRGALAQNQSGTTQPRGQAPTVCLTTDHNAAKTTTRRIGLPERLFSTQRCTSSEPIWNHTARGTSTHHLINTDHKRSTSTKKGPVQPQTGPRRLVETYPTRSHKLSRNYRHSDTPTSPVLRRRTPTTTPTTDNGEQLPQRHG